MPPTGAQKAQKSPKFQNQSKFSLKITSLVEGKELGELKKLWRDIACSEQRLKLIAELKSKKLGFNEIEMFSLGLRYNLKSEKMKDPSRKPTQQIVEAAMALKMRDEENLHRELVRRREKLRKWLKGKHEHKKHQYRKLIENLRKEAQKAKEIQIRKYKKKKIHLEKKYKEEEQQEVIPTGMEHLMKLSVFRKEEFEKIEKGQVQVPKIGELILSKQEEEILKRTPKFAIPEVLEEHTMMEEMEKSYSKIRMELRDEELEDEELNKEITEKITFSQEDREKEELRSEEDARCRQIYDPLEKKYDDRNRRVTDLPECSRVTLPRPINIVREAQIESRRELHNKIYQDYRKEFCNERGEQETDLTKEELRGLTSLKKRIKKGELVVMKTDKSGKFSITTREKYLEMGEAHVGNDEVIARKKVRETDKIMNSHSRAWCSIWMTGQAHGQEDRIVSSKASKSENTAKLYLAHKDHKNEADKTRPIGTANTSNTRGFANSVSDLLEAVANSEEENYEVISSEDMLHHVGNHNVRVLETDLERKELKREKMKCMACKLWKINCMKHECMMHENHPTEESEIEEVTYRNSKGEGDSQKIKIKKKLASGVPQTYETEEEVEVTANEGCKVQEDCKVPENVDKEDPKCDDDFPLQIIEEILSKITCKECQMIRIKK